MARPKKKPDDARQKLLQVRLQGREYKEFKKAAETTGLDLSAWVRERLKYAARKDMRTFKEEE